MKKISKRYPIAISGDLVPITAKTACCHCGLVHDFEYIKKIRGSHFMRVTVNKRASAALRRQRRWYYRGKLRDAGLL